MIREYLTRLKHSTEYLNYGRNIVSTWVADYLSGLGKDTANILDIGLGSGTDILNIKKATLNINCNFFGVESYELSAERARRNGINVVNINIECQALPFEDSYFDIIIANQIIEHTKEIFWIFSEISRVLKKGARVIIGVPNMASFHNRIALLLGSHPTSSKLLSAHVRGITKASFIPFITCGGYFNVLDTKGANFYPFPEIISTPLSRSFPTLSVAIFFLVERTVKDGVFIDVLRSRFVDTPYFSGERQ